MNKNMLKKAGAMALAIGISAVMVTGCGNWAQKQEVKGFTDSGAVQSQSNVQDSEAVQVQESVQSSETVQLSEDMQSSEEQLSIICTLFPQYDFARYIAGDFADVSMLLAPGQESHMFDPTPADMKAISACDVFIYTGDAMEGWAAQIVESLDDSVYVLDLSKYVTLCTEEDSHDGHGHDHHGHDHSGGYDPHYWLDMTNAAAMVEAIGETLKIIDPEHKEDYALRTQEYAEQLYTLDEQFMDTVAHAHRKDIVFGGRFAYSYFINRYGLSYETVYHSCSAESDPSVADMARVMDYIHEHHNTCIFYEELSSGTAAKNIAKDTGIQTAVFSTGHNVTKDEFDHHVTFIDLMNQNLEVLKNALEQ